MRSVLSARSFALLVLLGAVVSWTLPARADDAADAKKAIAAQFELLKAGDAEKLKEHFTDRQKEKITKEVVDKGKATAEKMTLDDLVASVELGEYEGKKTAKIKMKNGRTLTTLIQTNGKWLADTIWFR